MKTARQLDKSERSIPPPTVLVVEDDVLVRLTISEYLRDCGYWVLEAGSAEEALKILCSNAPADLVFTDVELSGPMNGLALAQWVRQARPNARIILASGNSAKAREARDICASAPFFAKPYRLSDVGARVASLLFSIQREE